MSIAAAEVYDSALAEHAEFAAMPAEALLHVAGAAISRIAEFEMIAREPITISPETAEDIGTVWIHSGTGNYDQPFKPTDNPRFTTMPFAGGYDRARINHAVYLARRIAEVRSGYMVPSGPLSSLEARKAETKELISEYGPTLFYSGYPSETAFAEELAERPGMIIPKNKLHILHKELKVTRDAIQTFEYADEDAARKNVAIVSHAPHLAGRILPMIERYQPFTDGSIPYVSPVATPDAGRDTMALMEARGLLYYTFLTGDAAVTPHEYQFIA